jgi:MFS family permease
VNACNSLGLVCTVVLLLRLGDVHRQGRALLLSQMIGALVLGTAAFAPTLSVFAASLFLWGVCGGVAMSMSRTIMQEQAPAALRGRVMSFYSFSFMGAGPVGALFSGYLVNQVGPQTALFISAGIMFAVILLVASTSSMWRLQGQRPDPALV